MEDQNNRWRTRPDLWEKLKPIAHEKRHKPTPAEKELWKYLKNKKLCDFVFRRQHCICQFIVDFYCYKAKLVIEVDGDIHRYKVEEDKIRQQYLEGLKLKVLRFPNDEVLNNTQKVVLQIKDFLTAKSSASFLPAERRAGEKVGDRLLLQILPPMFFGSKV
jgi:very-short-patch-repair endonuclease